MLRDVIKSIVTSAHDAEPPDLEPEVVANISDDCRITIGHMNPQLTASVRPILDPVCSSRTKNQQPTARKLNPWTSLGFESVVDVPVRVSVVRSDSSNKFSPDIFHHFVKRRAGLRSVLSRHIYSIVPSAVNRSDPTSHRSVRPVRI